VRRGKATAPYLRAFTLVELLAVVGVLGLLAAMVLPVLAKSVAIGRRSACVSNLRHLQTAYLMYLADHGNRLFPFVEDADDGKKLYYFGLSEQGTEGERALDLNQARLAPYLGGGGGVEICPAMPYRAAYFKKKYETASYGYGINVYLLPDQAQGKASGVTSFGGISRPAETIAWADSIQINQFQPPASPSNPMLEEWYILDGIGIPSHKYHFRHDRRVNVVFCDGSVKSLPPAWLDPRCDGLVGALESGTANYLLRTRK
jgi:prepilin-type processing-associated H-X9-DG protein/prepilin-type N-terminal cleavage/methylation domain-containing protein